MVVSDLHFYVFSYNLPIPRKRSTKSTKVVAAAVADNKKKLFESLEWKNDDHTMDKVLTSVKMYSFTKDGNNKGDRCDDLSSVISTGVTFRVFLKDFMFESKKNSSDDVFPQDRDMISQYSVIEVMVSASNSTAFESGYACNVSKIRPCEFSMYSLMSPLGLGLLKTNYMEVREMTEKASHENPGISKMLDVQCAGFWVSVPIGAYLVPYGDDFRLIGPHEDPEDETSRHVAVAPGVQCVDIPRDVLHRFTNAVEDDMEDCDNYARFIVDTASMAGSLKLYTVFNEYRTRTDPNRSQYVGVPLIDTTKLLEFIQITNGAQSIPWKIPTLVNPFIRLNLTPMLNKQGNALQISDLAISSPSGAAPRAYMVFFGDDQDDDLMPILFAPKSHSGSPSGGGLSRPEYRAFKRIRLSEKIYDGV